MFVKMSENTVSRVSVVDENWSGLEKLARPTSDMVSSFIDSALDFTMKRSSENQESVIRKIKSNDEWMNSTFRYALSKAIVSSLKNSPGFESLHLFGSVVSDSARLTSDINLLLHVNTDKEGFESWVALLDDQLVSKFRELFGLSDGFITLINCHVISDDDVKHRSGYASMLTSNQVSLISL